MHKRYLLSPLAAAITVLLYGGTALAQDQQDDQEFEGALEEVIVTGVKYSMTEAVEIKRESMSIIDSIVSEDLGKFPDNNVVEAMQRIPGVQVTDRGAGEASAVSIRGLADVTTTVNGRNIFTAAGRSVALQDIPSTLVSRVDVYKTRSAENIARGIAGGIDIHTFRPFDFEGFKLSAQARAIYQDEADEIDPQVSLLLSNIWDTASGEFGALINVAYTKTNWRDQGAHAGASFPFNTIENGLGQIDTSVGWTPGLDAGLPTAPGSTLDLNPDVEFLHWRDAMFNLDSRGERERPAANISLQWAPNDTSQYTFEVFYNGYKEDIFNSLWFQFLNSPIYDLNDPIEIYSGTNVIRSRTMGDGFSFTSGDVTWQETDSWLYALRGDWDLTDDLVLTSDLAFQDSEFKTDFWGQRVARIAPEFFIDINSGDGVPFLDYDPSGSGSPATDATNPANYWLDWGFVNGGRDSGDAFTWTADADWDVDWGTDSGGITTLSFGVRYDDRSATNKPANAPSGGPVDGTTLADLPAEFLTYNTDEFFGGQAGVLQAWAVADPNWVRANQDRLFEIYGFAPRTYNTAFEVDETQMAAYVQADFLFDFGVNSFIDGRVGLRYLDVDTDIAAPGEGGEFVTDNNSNSVVLPSLMVRWGISENLLARFSYTETFNLPAFGDLNPYIQYFPDVTDIGYGTASGGNSDLKPVESENIDISLEWYFAEGSVLYGTYFKRDITNNIVPFRNAVVYDVPDDVPDRGPYTYILSQPDNAGESSLDGWEFGFTYFPELPGWFDGLGVQASYTILDSEQELPVLDAEGNIVDYDIFSIGGVSDTSYSVILAYDRETFNMRLSYFWRDDFYNNLEAALFANPLQVWRGEEESLDFQLTWQFLDRWSATFDATNLTQPEFHWNYGNQPTLFNFHNYLYSKTYALGVRYQF
ncbi:MAG: TonB-dependent receptor [Xanthomonadales bacterium]